jgi:hypothetical protein
MIYKFVLSDELHAENDRVQSVMVQKHRQEWGEDSALKVKTRISSRRDFLKTSIRLKELEI